MKQRRPIRRTGAAAGIGAIAALAAIALPSLGCRSRTPDGVPDLRARAGEAAQWIRASAIRTPHGLVWPADPRNPESVNLTLYSGTPGVVLFLLELHRATGEHAALDEARLGADHLLASVDEIGSAGLYTGLAGIGYTLGEVHRATGDPRYHDGVAAVVSRLKADARSAGGGIEWSNVTDIIGGTAGTGLFLLRAAPMLSSGDALELARRAGDRLLELGVDEHGGTKWAMSPEMPRLMPNFSHGTAGIAYFLVELYRATGERRYLDGALAGARYLQAVANTENDVCLVFHHEPGEAGRNLFYLGYCHGPAGTARLWYGLHRAMGGDRWLEWTERSGRAILRSGIPEVETPGFWNNVSQCCGSAGVASFLRDMYDLTGRPEYRELSERITLNLLARGTRDGAGLRWLQAEHRVKPEHLVAQTGWMQGAAGIGAWLLQLDARQRGQQPLLRFPDDPFPR